ncbi:hypothetical protein Pint_06602 [Pistacia integerrima]|uniref:Uncharacterized protein n=1 Tax=Pistacia integerrima TaxID=434235 RepID=A0ACC0Z7B7_9ROSI|nr:hypothetical protein Pint_06602 [Pistacia integerrima]
MLIISPKITAQQPKYRYHICTNTSTFTPNSAFSRNLNQTLSSLLSNATLSNVFHNTTTGGLQDPDRANGLFLCRGDISPELCQSCVKASSENIITLCPNQKQAIIWYDECMLRYSNRSIFAVMEEEPGAYLWNINNVTSPSEFNETLGNLMTTLVNEAVGSSNFFATEDMNLTTFSRLYGLVQCTPDIFSSDCNICLTACVGEIPTCCNGKKGGRVYKPSCNIRFESYPFYTEASQPPLSPPTNATPPPSPPLPPATATNFGGKHLIQQIFGDHRINTYLTS